MGLVISTDVRWEFSAELDVLRDIKECRTIGGLEDCIQAIKTLWDADTIRDFRPTDAERH